MDIPKLHDDRKMAQKQWRALHTILWCKEKQNSVLRQKVHDLEKQLLMVDRQEIEALYSENERLINLLEERNEQKGL